VVELILGPMLRHVDRSSATIWCETDGPCVVEVLGHHTTTFTVEGHHYALVIVEGLQEGSCTEYDVRIDGVVAWPPQGNTFPPSVIRTVGDGPVRLLFGSCRTAAPHEPPYTLELALDPKGRGYDALRAHAMRMMQQPNDQWPHIAVMLGDQIYADDSSPVTRERIAQKRKSQSLDGTSIENGLSPEVVHGFEEYCWLYHESWSPDVERWFFSVVPTTMIFDDHDMIDDWNISDSWVREIRQQSWWDDHVVGGLATYWIYQHLGNLSPAEIRAQGILAALLAADDGQQYLRAWALQSEEFTPVPGGYRFSFARRLGEVMLVVIDARNGRVLKPRQRSMVDGDEWSWIVEQCQTGRDTGARHMVIGTSLPVFVPGGIDGLQRWNERVCDGAWGRVGARLGEKIRRGLDLEDWPAFARSFGAFVDLLAELGTAQQASPESTPSTISILSGDIHFSFHSRIHFPSSMAVASNVHQLVNSPIRNALRPFERAVMRVGTSRVGTIIGRTLRRSTGGRRSPLRWSIDHGPVFDNCVGLLTFDGESALLRLEHASVDADGAPHLEVAFDVDLVED
jgi:hypothetical protein